MAYHAPNPNHEEFKTFIDKYAKYSEGGEEDIIRSQIDNLIDCQKVKIQSDYVLAGAEFVSSKQKLFKGTYALFHNGFAISYKEKAFKKRKTIFYNLSKLLQVIPLYDNTTKDKEFDNIKQKSYVTSVVLIFFESKDTNSCIYVTRYRLISNKTFNANRFYQIISRYGNYIFSKENFIIGDASDKEMIKKSYNSGYSRPEIAFNYYWNENKSHVKSLLRGKNMMDIVSEEKDEDFIKNTVNSLILHTNTLTFQQWHLHQGKLGTIRYKFLPSVIEVFDVARNIENLVLYNYHHHFIRDIEYEINFEEFNFILTKFFKETDTLKKVTFEMSDPENAYQFANLDNEECTKINIKSFFVKAINKENMVALLNYVEKNPNIEELGFIQDMNPDIKAFEEEGMKNKKNLRQQLQFERRLEEMKLRLASLNYLLSKIHGIIVNRKNGKHPFKSLYFREFSVDTIMNIIGAFNVVQSITFVDVTGPQLTLKQISEIIYSGYILEFHFNNIAMKEKNDDYLFALPPRPKPKQYLKGPPPKYMYPTLISIADTEWTIEGLLSVFREAINIDPSYRITLSFPNASLTEPWNNFFSELLNESPKTIPTIEGFEISSTSDENSQDENNNRGYMTGDLFTFLGRCPNLKVLKLQGVIQSNILVPLTNLIKNSNLRVLDITNNNLSGPDIEVLVDAVVNSKLEELRIAGHKNYRKQDVFLRLVDAPNLRVLDISSKVMQLGKIRQVADEVKRRDRGPLEIVWPYSTLKNIKSISAMDVGELYQSIYESAHLPTQRPHRNLSRSNSQVTLDKPSETLFSGAQKVASKTMGNIEIEDKKSSPNMMTRNVSFQNLNQADSPKKPEETNDKGNDVKEKDINIEELFTVMIKRRMLDKSNKNGGRSANKPKPQREIETELKVKARDNVLQWDKAKKVSDNAPKIRTVTYAAPLRKPLKIDPTVPIPDDVREKYFSKDTQIEDRLYSFYVKGDSGQLTETDYVIALRKAIECDDALAAGLIGTRCYLNEEIIRAGSNRGAPTLPILYAAQISTLDVVKALEQAGADIFGTDRRGNNILMIASGVNVRTINKPRPMATQQKKVVEEEKKEAEKVKEVKDGEKEKKEKEGEEEKNEKEEEKKEMEEEEEKEDEKKEKEKEEEEAKEIEIKKLTQNNISIIEYLLKERKFNPNVVNVFGDTALHFACLSHNVHAATLLRDAGADRDILNMDNISPYGIANKDLEDEVSKVVIGSEVPWPPTATVVSAQKELKMVEDLEQLLNIFNPAKSARMMQFMSVKRGYIPIENKGDFVSTLTAAILGIKIEPPKKEKDEAQKEENDEEKKEEKKEEGPKLETFEENRIKLIKAISPFCNLEAHSYRNQSALNLACVYGTPAIIRTLVEAGADVNARRADEKSFKMYSNSVLILGGATPLMVISEKFGNKTAMRFDPEKENNEIMLELAQLFIDNGANVNAQDINSGTVIRDCNTVLKEFLKERGADMNIMYTGNSSGNSNNVIFLPEKEKQPKPTESELDSLLTAASAPIMKQPSKEPAKKIGLWKKKDKDEMELKDLDQGLMPAPEVPFYKD